MARPPYLNEKGLIVLTSNEWDSLQGDGTPENPFTVVLEGTKKRIKLTGTFDLSDKKGHQFGNIVDGISVKRKNQPNITVDTTEATATPPSSSGGNANVNVRSKYGIGEALLNHPIYGTEIKNIYALLNAGKLAEAEEAYFKSAWGKLDTDAQDNILLQLENDKLYKERLRSWKIGIKQKLANRGLTADDATLDQYFLDGIDDATIFDDLASGIKAKGATGEIGSALESLRGVARANGFNLEKDFGNQVDGWLQRISRGESLDDFTRLIRQQAKLGLPEKVGALLDEGLDLSNIYAPYRTRMANLLEVTPDSISLDDPLLRSAYGQDKEMSLYDFQRAVRKDPRWQYTDNAREEVSSVALNVLRDFGFQG